MNDYTATIVVDQTPHQVFNAVTNVRGWWTENLEGGTDQVDDEFAVQFGDVHYSSQRLLEVIPDEKVVWLVTDSRLTFVRDPREWVGTKITFDISPTGNGTTLRFTHLGLVPEYECFDDCSSAWSGYVNGSLRSLITTGEGSPTKKE